jgi:hypothetical protein
MRDLQRTTILPYLLKTSQILNIAAFSHPKAKVSVRRSIMDRNILTLTNLSLKLLECPPLYSITHRTPPCLSHLQSPTSSPPPETSTPNLNHIPPHPPNNTNHLPPSTPTHPPSPPLNRPRNPFSPPPPYLSTPTTTTLYLNRTRYPLSRHHLSTPSPILADLKVDI